MNESITSKNVPVNIITFKGLNSYKHDLSFEISTDYSNCKLSYIHQLGNLIMVKDDVEKKKVVNAILRRCKGYVIVNTIRPQVKQFLEENYPIYFSEATPVGYANTDQYIVCFKNPLVQNKNCRKPYERKTKLSREHIEAELRKILKSKRRKDDYVKDFIESL